MSRLLRGLGLIFIVSFWDGGVFAQNLDLGSVQTAYDKGQYTVVISTLSPKVETLDRQGLILLAKAYSAGGNPSSAIKTLTAALSKNPKDLEVRTLIGEANYYANKEREAIDALKEVISMDKKYVPAYRELIRIYDKTKNKYELRILYQDLVEAVGMRPEFANKLCMLSATDGLYDLSINYCQKGIQLNVKEPENFVYLGITYKSTGKEDLGEKVLKKAAQQFPLSWLAQQTYALHLDEKKNFVGSYQYYKRAIQADKKSLDSVLGAGFSSIEIQKFGEALGFFNHACKMDKTSIIGFRRALNLVRASGHKDWYKKFDSAVDRCN